MHKKNEISQAWDQSPNIKFIYVSDLCYPQTLKEILYAILRLCAFILNPWNEVNSRILCLCWYIQGLRFGASLSFRFSDYEHPTRTALNIFLYISVTAPIFVYFRYHNLYILSYLAQNCNFRLQTIPNKTWNPSITK